MDWEHEDIELLGLKMRVWSYGPKDAKPIFCLHGFTGSGRDFSPLIQAWSGEPMRWICPDLPGHGDSAGDPRNAEHYAWTQTVARLEALSEHFFKDRERAVLMGYSMGGRLSLALTCRMPRLFSEVIIVGASPGLREESAKRERRANDDKIARLIEEQGLEAFLDYWNRQPLIASQSRIEDQFRDPMLERRHQADGRAWAAALRGSGTAEMPSLWERLPNIRQPVLVAVGADDEAFVRIAQDIFFRIPKASEVVIPKAGHAAHMENPQAVAEEIFRFLEPAKGHFD